MDRGLVRTYAEVFVGGTFKKNRAEAQIGRLSQRGTR
jgi:hypothetical protein